MPSRVPARASLRRLVTRGAAAVCAATLAAITVVLVVSTRGWNRIQAETVLVLGEQVHAERIVRRVQGQVLLASYFLGDPQPRYEREFNARGDEVYEELRSYLQRDLPAGDRSQVEEIKTLHQSMEATARLLFTLARQGDVPHARQYITRLVDQSQELQRRIDRLMQASGDRLERLHQSQRRVMQQMYAAMALLAVVLLLFILQYTRVVQRRLLRPLQRLAVAASRLGEGDAGARVEVDRTDELGALGESFNQMAERLQRARAEEEARNLELSETLRTLRDTQQQMVQAEKLTALGEMLAGLAHELNNPLANILGYGELLQAAAREQPAGGGEPLAELTQPLVSEALRARDLVRNLLHFSRSAGVTVGPVELGEAVRVAANLRGYAFAQAGRALRVEVPPGVWVVAEAQRLQQVFLNLINNAFDALAGRPPGASLRIHTAPVDEEGWVEVRVEDDGPGLAEPERVFDPFYTTKAVGEGTGLGLTLVHRMLGDFGGSVEARNRPGGGACFVLRLRAASPPQLEVAPSADLVQDAPEAGPLRREGAREPAHVLVVDDEPPLLSLQRRILEALGARVSTAASGAEARALLSTTEVDLVVSDVRMPGEVGGIELQQWLAQEHPALAQRFIFVSGDSYGGPDSDLSRAFPGRVLAKPFQQHEYEEMVRRVLAQAG